MKKKTKIIGSDTPGLKKRDTWYKDIYTNTVSESFSKMDEWGRSKYDMLLVAIEYPDLQESNYEMKVRLFGWENDFTREYYDC